MAKKLKGIKLVTSNSVSGYSLETLQFVRTAGNDSATTEGYLLLDGKKYGDVSKVREEIKDLNKGLWSGVTVEGEANHISTTTVSSETGVKIVISALTMPITEQGADNSNKLVEVGDVVALSGNVYNYVNTVSGNIESYINTVSGNVTNNLYNLSGSVTGLSAAVQTIEETVAANKVKAGSGITVSEDKDGEKVTGTTVAVKLKEGEKALVLNGDGLGTSLGLKYDPTNKKIILCGATGEIESIDATAFIKDGMLYDAKVGKASTAESATMKITENGKKLTVTFNKNISTGETESTTHEFSAATENTFTEGHGYIAFAFKTENPSSGNSVEYTFELIDADSFVDTYTSASGTYLSVDNYKIGVLTASTTGASAPTTDGLATAKDVYSAITAATNGALTGVTSAGTGDYVSAVTVDGKNVKVTYGSLPVKEVVGSGAISASVSDGKVTVQAITSALTADGVTTGTTALVTVGDVKALSGNIESYINTVSGNIATHVQAVSGGLLTLSGQVETLNASALTGVTVNGVTGAVEDKVATVVLSASDITYVTGQTAEGATTAQTVAEALQTLFNTTSANRVEAGTGITISTADTKTTVSVSYSSGLTTGGTDNKQLAVSLDGNSPIKFNSSNAITLSADTHDNSKTISDTGSLLELNDGVLGAYLYFDGNDASK